MSPSQKLLVRLCVELPLVFIWFSVLCCVIRQVLRKGSVFATGFFKLYVAQSIVDIAAYTSFIVAYEFGMLAWLPSWLSSGVGQQILFGFTGYVEYQHYSLHLLMTANRFITFGTQAYHKWSSGFRLRIAAMLSILIPLGAAYLSNVTIECAGDADVLCQRISYSLTFLVSFCCCGLCAVVSIALDLLTVKTFHQLTARMRRRRHEDFLLLIFSLLQFAVLAILTAIYGAMTFGALTENQDLIDHLYAFAKYIVDILCFTGPVFLLSTSGTLRREYARMFNVYRTPTPVTMLTNALKSSKTSHQSQRQRELTPVNG